MPSLRGTLREWCAPGLEFDFGPVVSREPVPGK